MNISDYSIITKNDSPYTQAGRLPPGGAGRQRARSYADEAEQDQKAKATPRVEQVVDAVAEKQSTRAVIPVSDVYSSQRRAQFYQVEDVSRFTSTQRKALQLYSANQGLSMLDANADFLGAVDTYA